MKSQDRINSQKNTDYSTDKQNKKIVDNNYVTQYLELDEEEIIYSLEVYRLCIC